MKLAIYGDSFANDISSRAWPRILSKKLGATVYRNYQLNGSSVDYSYFHHKENHHLFDLNIFVITEVSRYSLWRHDEPYASFRSKPEYLKSEFSRFDRVIRKMYDLEQLKRTYFPDAYKHYVEAMLDSIILRNPKTLLVNAMAGFHPITREPNKGMFEIQYLDYRKFNLEQGKKLETPKDRPCHMSFEQNKEFANYMLQHIKGEIDIHDTFDNAFDFYTPSENLEKSGIRD